MKQNLITGNNGNRIPATNFLGNYASFPVVGQQMPCQGDIEALGEQVLQGVELAHGAPLGYCGQPSCARLLSKGKKLVLTKCRLAFWFVGMGGCGGVFVSARAAGGGRTVFIV